MLLLRVVQAKFGDCLILKYGNPEKPKYILIDGGPGGVYANYLRPELEKLRADGGELELIILSHVDGDHIVGLIDFTQELLEQQVDEIEPLIPVKRLWLNCFNSTIGKGNALTQAVLSLFSRVQNIQSTMPEGNLAFQSIGQGNTLMRNAHILGIPVNEVVNQDVITLNSLPQAIKMDSLRLSIVGPNQENLDKLKAEWEDWIRKNEAKIMMSEPEVLSSIDKSVPNLSSIMFLLESEGKSILFTGDGRGDFILEGLAKAGLSDSEGRLHVDVFKVPHHGSIRNSTEDFFLKVTADLYIISADGRHNNPDYETLKWIVESAWAQKRKIRLLCTNETDSTRKLLKSHSHETYGYEMTVLDVQAGSYDIELS